MGIMVLILMSLLFAFLSYGNKVESMALKTLF